MLYSQLEVLRLPTDELILRFLSELLEFQRREFERERPLGTLEINMCYNKEESAVEVTVVKGEKFPISNRNGNLVIDLDSHSHRYNPPPPSNLTPLMFQEVLFSCQYHLQQHLRIPRGCSSHQHREGQWTLSITNCSKCKTTL